MNPQEGDVVVVRQATNARGAYVVQQWLRMPQVSCASRDAAIGFAASFARRQAVDVWYREAETYTLLERYRAAAS